MRVELVTKLIVGEEIPYKYYFIMKGASNRKGR